MSASFSRKVARANIPSKKHEKRINKKNAERAQWQLDLAKLIPVRKTGTEVVEEQNQRNTNETDS